MFYAQSTSTVTAGRARSVLDGLVFTHLLTTCPTDRRTDKVRLADHLPTKSARKTPTPVRHRPLTLRNAPLTAVVTGPDSLSLSWVGQRARSTESRLAAAL